VKRALALLLPCLAGCAGAPEGGRGSPELRDLDGARHQPFTGGERVTVLLFLATDCPIANSYAPEIAALVRDHERAPVRFFLVHVDPQLDVPTAREHARAFGLPGPILLDQDRALVALTGVTVTPEAVVLDRSGRLAYRGRIDDGWADLGRRRTTTGSRDLRTAIAAVVSGRAVPSPWPPAIGCTIQ
jgi:thiol-disulfide isomerase/thioredoxin